MLSHQCQSLHSLGCIYRVPSRDASPTNNLLKKIAYLINKTWNEKKRNKKTEFIKANANVCRQKKKKKKIYGWRSEPQIILFEKIRCDGRCLCKSKAADQLFTIHAATVSMEPIKWDPYVEECGKEKATSRLWIIAFHMCVFVLSSDQKCVFLLPAIACIRSFQWPHQTEQKATEQNRIERKQSHKIYI